MIYTDEKLEEALQVMDSMLGRCEKAQLKFTMGSSQYTLLRNRIKALYISKSLLMEKADCYTKDELLDALPPVISIISKCAKAQSKHVEGAALYKRYRKMMQAMQISESFIRNEINKEDCT